VIVPIRLAQETVSRTLDQLAEQAKGIDAEVIAAISLFDPTAVEERPGILILRVPGPAGIPQLRRDAVLAARGDLIIITEDHCTFPEGWLVNLVRACQSCDGSVCGGRVANGRDTLTGWGQYFTRYAAFLPNRAPGPTNGLPGNNACYPRRLIFDRVQMLTDGFWEAEFNDRLRQDGVTFQFLPQAPLIQNQCRGALEYIPLRYRHGRCYGARRVVTLGSRSRIELLFLSPILPALLFFRIARSVFITRYERRNFILSVPLILLYVLAWSAGEIIGYLLGAGDSCLKTD
jgi:hypothetical protein